MSDHDGVEQVITMAWRAHNDSDDHPAERAERHADADRHNLHVSPVLHEAVTRDAIRET